MTWTVTRTRDEDTWFKDYVRIALGSIPAQLPSKRQKLGAVHLSWFECEPGVVFINAEGGTFGDRILARSYLAAQLAGHGFKQAQFHFDGNDELRKTAGWTDIMAKAARLIDERKVALLRNGYNNIIGRVKGDHGTYQTEIGRDDPESRAITTWECQCPWDQFAWQRTRQWKKYEGRPCAHVLATYWKSLGTPIDEDVHPQQMALPGMPPAAPGGSPFAPRPQQMMQPMPQGQQLQMAMPGQAIGQPPTVIPPDILPQYPMEGMPTEPVVSIPGAKPQTPLNPVQYPGGTLSSIQDDWNFGVTAAAFNVQPEGFINGNIVQLLEDDMGIAEGKSEAHGAGQYLSILQNTKGVGEVMGMDTLPGLGQVVEVNFPLDHTGPMEPYSIRAWLRPDQLKLRPDVQRPGPFLKRR